MYMQPKPHGKSNVELKAMKMPQLLKLVTKNHLAQHIHLYRRMRKDALVQALQLYEQSVPASEPMKRKPAPKTKVKMSKPEAAKDGKLGTKAKPKATTMVSGVTGKRTRKKPQRLVEE
jgi:hypothetical protein